MRDDEKLPQQEQHLDRELLRFEESQWNAATTATAGDAVTAAADGDGMFLHQTRFFCFMNVFVDLRVSFSHAHWTNQSQYMNSVCAPFPSVAVSGPPPCHRCHPRRSVASQWSAISSCPPLSPQAAATDSLSRLSHPPLRLLHLEGLTFQQALAGEESRVHRQRVRAVPHRRFRPCRRRPGMCFGYCTRQGDILCCLG